MRGDKVANNTRGVKMAIIFARRGVEGENGLT